MAEEEAKLQILIREEIASQLAQNTTWEDQITIREKVGVGRILPSVSEYCNDKTFITPESLRLEKSIEEYIRRDTLPLPTMEDREGYGADRHFEYWLSGLSDYLNIRYFLNEIGSPLKAHFSIFDLGCASGRVIRHFLCQEEGLDLWCSDISSRHVEWIIKNLNQGVRVFQNHALPHLPIEDNRFDLVVAFSVFSHIDAFELAWLQEVNRITKPGGFALLSIHSEHTWSIMREEFPIYQILLEHPDFSPELLKSGLPEEKLVYQWRTDSGYRANVFYDTNYIRKIWGNFFEVMEIIPEGHQYQDMVLLKK